jgi:hypothetical protein
MLRNKKNYLHFKEALHIMYMSTIVNIVTLWCFITVNLYWSKLLTKTKAFTKDRPTLQSEMMSHNEHYCNSPICKKKHGYVPHKGLSARTNWLRKIVGPKVAPTLFLCALFRYVNRKRDETLIKSRNNNNINEDVKVYLTCPKSQ